MVSLSASMRFNYLCINSTTFLVEGWAARVSLIRPRS